VAEYVWNSVDRFVSSSWRNIGRLEGDTDNMPFISS
jgi:hypothetical protein